MINAALLLATAPAWFGPATVSFSADRSGNPFSPEEADAKVVFMGGGKKIERLAYWAKDKWHATLAAPTGGVYTAQFILNGRLEGEKVKLRLDPAKDGEFVKLDRLRFKLTSGKPYIPLGHNFGWESRDATFPKQLGDMAAAGINWTRIWACSWDGKNPYIPQEETTKIALGSMYEPALDRWSMIVDECEKHNIKFQFVLFHHGMYSTTTDSNWRTHPWNKANGGFLEKASDFFTDPTAKRLSKAWLRYAVARWGHSTSIMAWELFNEVQWVDKVKEPGGWDVVAAWHKEMAAYLRSIDPYKHLVTSSSEVDPKVYSPMDYEQPHTYPPSVYGALLGAKLPADKPLFFGEFGGPGGTVTEIDSLREGFWGGLLGGHAGPGAYWFWDRAYRDKLYPEYARQSKILPRTAFAQNPDAIPGPIVVSGAPEANLTLRPGRGWAPTEQYVYDLPTAAATGALPQLSGYIQGAKGANRKMMAEPIRLRFRSPRAAEGKIIIGQVSRQGGGLTVKVNGIEVVSKEWAGNGAENQVRFNAPLPFPAGDVVIEIDNPGADWVTLDSVTLPGVGYGVSAVALRGPRYALARLKWSSHGAGPKTLSLPKLPNGMYEVRQFDLDTAKEKVSQVKFVNGVLAPYVPMALDEGVVILKK
jgi:hypothetical protein